MTTPIPAHEEEDEGDYAEQDDDDSDPNEDRGRPGHHNSIISQRCGGLYSGQCASSYRLTVPGSNRRRWLLHSAVWGAADPHCKTVQYK